MVVVGSVRIREARCFPIWSAIGKSYLDLRTSTPIPEQCYIACFDIAQIQLTLHFGINQAIDDDYVNCPVPKTAGFGSASNCDFVRATVKHAQISSAISKQLLSAKARQEPAETTVANVRALDERLNNWHKSLPHRFNTQAPFRNLAQASGTQLYHDLFLHFSYQASIIGIHGVFCYPWNKPELQSYKSPQVASQIQKSTEAVAEASRQIIIAVQGLQITSAMPLWYVPNILLATAACPRKQKTPRPRQVTLNFANGFCRDEG